MTLKEAIEQIEYIAKQAREAGEYHGGQDVQDCLDIVRQIEDRSEEMIKCIKARLYYCFGGENEWYRGREDLCRWFLKKFDADDQLWIKGWDYNA